MTPLYLPEMVLAMLQAGMDCVVSISGGKDSQAMLIAFVAWFRAQGFTGQLFALHVTLGRAERTETPGFLETLCARLAVPLQVVQPIVGEHPGDLQDSLQRRMHTLAGTGKPFWPTMGMRYCTSLKRGACDKELRHSPFVLSLEGIRAEESEERAEKEPFTLRSTITGERYKHLLPDAAWALYQADHASEVYQFFDLGTVPSKGPRLAFTLYPLFFWTQEEVWQGCGTSRQDLLDRRVLYLLGVDQQNAALRARALDGWPAHPAYVKGANRLSCSLCVLADKMTLRSGAYNRPTYYRALVWMEIESGFPFQPSRWLCDVAPELLTEEQHEALAHLPQRIAWLLKKRRLLPVV